MRVSRRMLVAGTAGLALAGAGPARADDYPSKTIRLILGYTPGGGTDFSARVMAEALTARLGQTVVVENRPGAASMIAMDYVAKSTPDGYTLIWADADGTAMLTAEKPRMPYRFAEDFTYIARLLQFPHALVIGPKLKVAGIAALIAYAKAHPGVLRYGTTGVGGSSHLTGLLFEQQAGISMTAVPYKGAAPAMTDLLGGFIDLAFLTPTSIGDQAKSGRVKVLATSLDVRDPNMPDVPTMSELGFPGATLIDWFGLLGPAKLPANVVARLGKAVTDALGDPAVRQRLLKVDLQPAPLLGEAFRKSVVAQYAQWKVIAQSAHIVAE